MPPLNRLPSPWLARAALLLASLGWAVVLGADAARGLPALCGSWAGALLGDAASAALLLQASAGDLLWAWLAMLAAMMPPLLLGPAALLWQRSLARRRWRAILLFTSGYVVLWTCAGLPLLGLALLLQLAAGSGAPPAFAAGLVLALLWQASPWRQQALNRCHRQPRLAAFGARADRDALRYGGTHALACIAACWAWMLLPLLAGGAHLALMLGCGLLLALERGLPSQPARWRLPFGPLLAAWRQSGRAVRWPRLLRPS